MAQPTDPTFGAGFNADEFRNAIEQTMIMGLPENVSEQATFHWDPNNTYEVKDITGNPYDWTATPVTSSQKAPVVIPVAAEFSARTTVGAGTPFGDIESPKVILTILDRHIDQVRGANRVSFDGNDYQIKFMEPPIGLFTVTVYRMHCDASDES